MKELIMMSLKRVKAELDRLNKSYTCGDISYEEYKKAKEEIGKYVDVIAKTVESQESEKKEKSF